MTRLPCFPPTANRTTDPKRVSRVPRHLGRLFAGIVVVVSLSCGGLVNLLRDRVVGHIDFSDVRGHEPQIPETATAGVPFPVTVWTMGGGCHDGGDTEVDVDGLSAEVTPYDYLRTGAGVCTDILLRFEHKVTVRFDAPGPGEVVLRYSTDSWDHNSDGRKVFTVEVSPAR